MGKLKFDPPFIINLLICSGSILFFIFFLIWPLHISISRTDKEIDRVKSRIEEQKILYPVYCDLLKTIKQKVPEGVFAKNSAKPVQYDPEEITLLIQEIAAGNNLEVRSIVQDVGSLIDDAGYLIIDASVAGAFKDFRNFLVQIGGMRYANYMEELQIKESGDGGGLLFGFKIRVLRKRVG
jgi:hypothetical protein